MLAASSFYYVSSSSLSCFLAIPLSHYEHNPGAQLLTLTGFSNTDSIPGAAVPWEIRYMGPLALHLPRPRRPGNRHAFPRHHGRVRLQLPLQTRLRGLDRGTVSFLLQNAGALGVNRGQAYF
jgi:hypothetical protein